MSIKHASQKLLDEFKYRRHGVLYYVPTTVTFSVAVSTQVQLISPLSEASMLASHVTLCEPEGIAIATFRVVSSVSLVPSIDQRNIVWRPVASYAHRNATGDGCAIKISPFCVHSVAFSATSVMFGHSENTNTIRYDTRCYFNVRSKADISHLNLPHGTDN